jgi:hypothetical protein
MVRTFLLAACPHFLMTSDALPHGTYIHSGSLPSFPHDIICPALMVRTFIVAA